MLGGELDFLCLVPDNMGDPGVGVAIVGPAELDRDQRHQRPPCEGGSAVQEGRRTGGDATRRSEQTGAIAAGGLEKNK